MAENTIDSLRSWLDACPTPFHVVARAQEQLATHGFTDTPAFSSSIAQQGFQTMDGSIIAWSLGRATESVRIIGAHTDSPNLRVQPSPNISRSGWSQLGVEIYGGVLLNSWLDRDLGIAGRVINSLGESHLFSCATPLARVAQLAIHLDRDVNEKGVLLDKSQHITPLWGSNELDFQSWLQQVSGMTEIMAFDAHLFDITPASVLGHDQSLLTSGRLDNQISCWASINAIASHDPHETTSIVVLNDHEEVGSSSASGAGGPMLENLLSVIAEQFGLSTGQKVDMMRNSWCVSADNAHAIHPNYPERHDSLHSPFINAGPVLKLNGNQRYATTSRGAAHMRTICASADIALQTFVSRNNMPCGSTIGPITATRLGIECIDVGVPQLSMHSARELCGVKDPPLLVKLLSTFLQN